MVRPPSFLANRILQELAVPFSSSGRDITTGASIGIMLGAPAYASPVEVLRDADTAMYRAKAAGRNQYAIFDSAMAGNRDRGEVD